MKGNQLERALEFFRETNLDVARIALARIKEIVDERLTQAKHKVMPGPPGSGPTPVRKARKKKATQNESPAASPAQAPTSASANTQSTIAEQAKAMGAAPEVTV